jgi:hypothetical protein
LLTGLEALGSRAEVPERVREEASEAPPPELLPTFQPSSALGGDGERLTGAGPGGRLTFASVPEALAGYLSSTGRGSVSCFAEMQQDHGAR